MSTDEETQQTGTDRKGKRFPRLSSEGFRFLIRFIRPYSLKFGVAVGALLLSSLASLAFPGLTGALIDAVESPGSGLLGNLDRLALVFLVILLIQSLFSFIRTYLLQEVSERSLADLRMNLYSHLLLLPIDFFHRNRVGDLTSRLGTDITSIQTTMTTTLSELIRQAIILVGGITLVIYTSPRLTLVIVGALPVVVVLAVLFGRIIRRSSTMVQNEYAALNTVAEESFQAIAVVKAFVAEAREVLRFRGRLDEIINISLRVARARALFIAFVVFALFGGVVGVIWYGGTLVQSGNLSIGELTSFVLYAVFVGGAMGSFADLYGGLQRSLGAAERIQAILKESPEGDRGADHLPSNIQGGFELDHVSFAYPTRPDMPVIKNVSLQFAAGKTTAIVGPSGSGKSTLTNLLLRFYDPDAGDIRMDKVSIRDIVLAEYRDQVAIVPQEVILFGGTIRDNIGYGRPDASESDVIEAATLANAMEFVERFPDGLETIVGERGVQLSGGQRQRLAIARALLKDPRLLILDEATSALDTESENLVQEALDRVMEDRTTVIIAHRLSTVRNADRIVLLSNGSVEESGSYDELIARDGVFARMVSLQRIGDGDVAEERLFD